MISCLSAGMRLATMESEREINNLIYIATMNSDRFENETHIGGKDLVERQEEDDCISFFKIRKWKKVFRKLYSCSAAVLSFLCEDAIITDKFEEATEKVNGQVIDVKAKFFTHIGDYSELKVIIRRGRELVESNF